MGGRGGLLLNGQNLFKCDESYLSTVPKLTVCGKSVTTYKKIL